MRPNRTTKSWKRALRVDLIGGLGILLIVAVLLFGLRSTVNAQTVPRVTGTYSNMSYVAESGDVVGYEIKIVYTGSELQGALQIAEGVPGDLITVHIEQNGTSIRFKIPGGPYVGEFRGTIANGWLRGEFHFSSGGEDHVALRKGKSYWD